MATMTAVSGIARTSGASRAARADRIHRLLLTAAACAAAGLIVLLAARGFPYYLLRLEDRPFSPLHAQLRSSGTIGLKLGLLSLGMFGLLFLYPLRKRSKRLSMIGNTRRWLNFHILLGITTPFVVTFHTTFRTHGIAGVAYWTMVAVAASGFIGRYAYSKIPRSRSAAELSMQELEADAAALAERLREQSVFREEDLAPLLAVPSPQAIRHMNPMVGLWKMLKMDLERPFLVSRLRRHALKGSEGIATLGGLLASHDAGVESIVSIVGRQSRLRFAIAFLDRTERVFHLWHLVHRPFSISFIVLLAVHIVVALGMGASSWRVH